MKAFFEAVIDLIRQSIRPGFTAFLAYYDLEYFTTPQMWRADGPGGLLLLMNGIILVFWFGERALSALAKSGVLEVWLNRSKGKPNGDVESTGTR